MSRAIKQPSFAEWPINGCRIIGQPERTDFPFFEMLLEDGENRRVQVKMEMAVYMIQRQSCGRKLRKLLGNLHSQLRPSAPGEKVVQACANWRITELAEVINQIWDLRGS